MNKGCVACAVPFSFIVNYGIRITGGFVVWHGSKKNMTPDPFVPFSSPVLTRSPRWHPQCWWSTVQRMRWLTSRTAWPCTSAAPVPLSPCGWREPATTTLNSTLSTWKDSSSSSHLSFPLPEGSSALRPGFISTHSTSRLLIIFQLCLWEQGQGWS